MNLRTVVLTLLLSAGALALAPPAQAAEALDPCPALDAQSLLLGVTVEYDATTRTCNYTVGLIDGQRTCNLFAGVEHGQVRQSVETGGDVTGDPNAVHVVVNYCYPIIYCTCDPIVTPIAVEDVLNAFTTSSADLQPPIYCIREPCGPYPPPVAVSWCVLKAATPEPLYTRLWGTDAGCDIDVETNWYCIYDEIPVDRTVGPVHLVTRVCTPNIEPVELQ